MYDHLPCGRGRNNAPFAKTAWGVARCARSLGNGFPLSALSSGQHALLVGGGIGVPPLYELAKQLVKNGVCVTVVLGFQTKEVVFYEQQFASFGKTYVATADGSYGMKGFVTDVIQRHALSFDVLYACTEADVKSITTTISA